MGREREKGKRRESRKRREQKEKGREKRREGKGREKRREGKREEKGREREVGISRVHLPASTTGPSSVFRLPSSSYGEQPTLSVLFASRY